MSHQLPDPLSQTDPSFDDPFGHPNTTFDDPFGHREYVEPPTPNTAAASLMQAASMMRAASSLGADPPAAASLGVDPPATSSMPPHAAASSRLLGPVAVAKAYFGNPQDRKAGKFSTYLPSSSVELQHVIDVFYDSVSKGVDPRLNHRPQAALDAVLLRAHEMSAGASLTEEERASLGETLRKETYQHLVSHAHLYSKGGSIKSFADTVVENMKPILTRLLGTGAPPPPRVRASEATSSSKRVKIHHSHLASAVGLLQTMCDRLDDNVQVGGTLAQCLINELFNAGPTSPHREKVIRVTRDWRILCMDTDWMCRDAYDIDTLMHADSASMASLRPTVRIMIDNLIRTMHVLQLSFAGLQQSAPHNPLEVNRTSLSQLVEALATTMDALAVTRSNPEADFSNAQVQFSKVQAKLNLMRLMCL